MTTVELLRDMRSRIESGWTQGTSARNRQGNPVAPCSPEASQWCIAGSMRANELIPLRTRQDAARIIGLVLSSKNESGALPVFNDSSLRTKKDVVQLLDESIVLAESGGYKW